jgi:hypothetical protein
MQVIPTQPLPNQVLLAQLNGQAVEIQIFQQAYGLYVTVTLGGEIVIASVIAYNKNRLIRYGYLGFSGDLSFIDTQGSDDPVYTGLGTRFQLAYLTPSDLAALGLTG